MNLSHRSTLTERMEDPESDSDLVRNSLRQFAVTNRWFCRHRSITDRFLVPHMLSTGRTSFRVIDVGAGAGDYAMWLCRHLGGRGIRVQITCLDHDARMVAYARENCRGNPDIACLEGSAFDLESADVRADYVVSNHLLHHFDETEVRDFVHLLNRAPRCGFLCNDLRRSYSSYYWFSVFSAVFLRNSYSRVDGLLSIRKAFAPSEILQLVRDVADGPGIHVETLAPARLVVHNLGRR